MQRMTPLVRLQHRATAVKCESVSSSFLSFWLSHAFQAQLHGSNCMPCTVLETAAARHFIHYIFRITLGPTGLGCITEHPASAGFWGRVRGCWRGQMGGTR